MLSQRLQTSSEEGHLPKLLLSHLEERKPHDCPNNQLLVAPSNSEIQLLYLQYPPDPCPKASHVDRLSVSPILTNGFPEPVALASAASCTSQHLSSRTNHATVASIDGPTVRSPWFPRRAALLFPKAFEICLPSSEARTTPAKLLVIL